MIDPDLIEQMLINLVRNAVDAALEQAQSTQNAEPPKVTIRWQTNGRVVLMVEDNGIGLLNPSNAFVPFYTTKPGGSGIGLVLCQQIAEAHGGSIELTNRPDARGCRVKVTLPNRQP
jgi:two-component system, NtrC family, nitrogen regulation sensor histidine kinase NtrY